MFYADRIYGEFESEMITLLFHSIVAACVCACAYCSMPVHSNELLLIEHVQVVLCQVIRLK